MTDTSPKPEGTMLLRTIAMPADTNPNGDIFGGWIMSQMDIGGGILAKEISRGRTCTVSVEGMTFHRPVQVGDVVCCYGRCERIGNSSMRIRVEVWVKPLLRDNESDRYCVTEAIFTYVAIDGEGRPRKIELSESEHPLPVSSRVS
ncbi:acyl-CoA thioester hydrolase YciA [Dongshaea marina]|uniref:acyl-CoA thioester hydrolase YciA n=1 Tax=Dongshaea marina TaxID=2047966 RepID=UPI000D3E105B|nr:acyl-CoA thioester hydrolase YciA [Dongshaea marina]